MCQKSASRPSEREVPVETLKQLLRLDVESGKLYWRSPPRRGVGIKGEAGSKTPQGYRMIGIDGTQYRAHRVVFAMMVGRWPKNDIDHLNLIKDDNRPANLREATRSQNEMNKGVRGDSSSDVTGVSWYAPSKRWRAYIGIDGKIINLGYYIDKDDAIAARHSAESERFGEFRRVA